ncbi:PQQ-binding-like beta-propeller repeat protein [Natrialba sp. INN-245]|uniref:outer membrane protein assembly factor BamB family protein n=1 Tax=Natrialba sp. INN-245 TaxID=2690967 RepID=UPI001358F9C0
MWPRLFAIAFSILLLGSLVAPFAAAEPGVGTTQDGLDSHQTQDGGDFTPTVEPSVQTALEEEQDSSVTTTATTDDGGGEDGFPARLDRILGSDTDNFGDGGIASSEELVFVTNGTDRLEAIDTNGDRVWSTTLDSIRSEPTVGDDVVYVTDRFSDTEIRAFNATDGSERWNTSDTTVDTINRNTPIVVGEYVYVQDAGDDTTVYALDPDTGTVVWEEYLTDSTTVRLAADDDTLYVVDDDHVFAMNGSTGEVVWDRGDWELSDSVSATPTVVDGTLYVTVAGGNFRAVYAFDSDDGVPQWRTPVPDDVDLEPVVADETVYIASGASVYAFETDTGVTESSYVTSGEIQDIVSGQYLYVASEDQRNNVGPGQTVTALEGDLSVAWASSIPTTLDDPDALAYPTSLVSVGDSLYVVGFTDGIDFASSDRSLYQFAPTALTVDDTTILEDSATVGETITVEATVSNHGEETETSAVTFEIDSPLTPTYPDHETVDVTVDPGETTTATLELTVTSSGSYEVTAFERGTGGLASDPRVNPASVVVDHASPDDNWTQTGYDAAGSHWNPNTAAPAKPLMPTWQFEATGGSADLGGNPVLVEDDTVVVHNRTTVWGLDLETGDELWEYRISVPDDADDTEEIGTHVVVDGVVYFGVSYHEGWSGADQRSRLYAVDLEDGTHLGDRHFDDRRINLQSLSTDGDSLFFTMRIDDSSDDNDGDRYLWAVDRHDFGEQRMQYLGDDGALKDRSQVLVAGDRLVIADGDSRLSPSEVRIFDRSTLEPTDSRTFGDDGIRTMITDGETIYLSLDPDDGGVDQLLALDPDGLTTEWQLAPEKFLERTGPATPNPYDKHRGLAVTDGTLITATRGAGSSGDWALGHYGIDTDAGEIEWFEYTERGPDTRENFQSPIVAADGLFYAGPQAYDAVTGEHLGTSPDGFAVAVSDGTVLGLSGSDVAAFQEVDPISVSDLELSATDVAHGESLEATVEVTNPTAHDQEVRVEMPGALPRLEKDDFHQYTTTLGPGESETITFSETPRTGDHSIHAEVYVTTMSSSWAVDDYYTYHTTASQTATVYGKPTEPTALEGVVIVDPQFDSEEVWVGENVTVTTELANLGDEAETFTLVADGDRSWVDPAEKTVTIPAGDNVSVEIGFEAEQARDGLEVTLNDLPVGTVDVLDLDLEIWQDLDETEIDPGESVSVTVEGYNDGNVGENVTLELVVDHEVVQSETVYAKPDEYFDHVFTETFADAGQYVVEPSDGDDTAAVWGDPETVIVGDVSISVQTVSGETNVVAGEPTTIVTELENGHGIDDGRYTLALEVDGEVVKTKKVVVQAGAVSESHELDWTFDESGEYEVSVNGETLEGGPVTVEPGDGPIASFGYAPADPVVGEEVTFDASASSVADGEIVEYRWDFNGDSAIDETTTEPVANWTYGAVGTHEPTLTVEDDEGRTDETTETVLITEPGSDLEIVDQYLSDDEIAVGENVTVTAVIQNTGGSSETIDLDIGFGQLPFYDDRMGLDVEGPAAEGPISVTVNAEDVKVVETELTFNEAMGPDPITVNGEHAGSLLVEDDTDPIPDQIVIDQPGVYSLEQDLSRDTSDAFVVIEADDVVFEGNGYTLEGTGSGTAIDATDVENVTVRDLQIRDWQYGLEFENVDDGVIEDVTTVGQDQAGIWLRDSTDVSVTNVHSIDNFGYGIHLDESSNNVLDHVTTHESGGWHGILLEDSNQNTISNVSTESNARDGVAIRHSNDNVLQHVTSEHNGQMGLRIADSADTEVYHTELRANNRHGVSLEPNPVGSSNGADRTELTNVTSEENGWSGINIVQSDQNQFEEITIRNNDNIGLNLLGSSWNTVEDVKIEGNSRGILVGADMITSDGDSNYNTFTDVSVHDNDQDSVMLTDDGDFSTPSPSVGNEFERLSIGNHTLTSFEGQMIELFAVEEPPSASSGMAGIDQYVEIVPESGGQVSPLSFHYELEDVQAVDTETLSIWAYDDTENEWSPVPGSTVDTDERVVTADVSSFSTFGVFGEETDAAFEVTDASVSPTQLEVGEDAIVTADVTNVGPDAGDAQIGLEIDGSIEDVQTVSLDPQQTATIEFVHSFAHAGEYDVSVGGEMAGTVTVEETDSDPDQDPGPEPEPEPESPAFDVTIENTSSPVIAGSALEVSATVENAGGEAGTQTIELVVDGAVVDSSELDLEAGATETISLTWTTDESDVGDAIPVAVRSEDDESTTTVSVEEADDEAEIIVYGADVDRTDTSPGETVTVTGDLYNAGNVNETDTIALEVDGEVVDQASVTLEPGIARGGVELTWTPTADDIPEGTDSVSVELTVNGLVVDTVTVEDRYSDIQVIAASTTETELIQGEETHVIGSLYQAGNAEGTTEIELTATHQETGETTVVGSQEATLEPGYYHLGGINITYVPEEAGTYDLELGERNAGTLEVEEAVTDIQVVAASTTEVDLIEGEETHVIGSVYQSGNVEGTEEIELTATNQETGETTVVGSQEVTLEPGYYHLGGINISYVPDEAGTYDLELDERNAGTIDVEPADTDIQVVAASTTEVDLIEGEETHVIGSVYQSGNVEGTEEIELTATNQETGETTVVGSQEVTLEPGYYHLGGINITYVPDEAGTYDLELGERNAGTIEVEAAESDVQVIAASPSEVELIEGEEMYVIGSIYQSGNVEGTEEIELTATNQETGETTVVGSQEATLEPGYYHLGGINITYVPDEAGTYDLELGERNAGTIEVEAAESDVQVIAASPSEVELIEGEEMHVIGSIYQAGNVEGTEEIELTATNQETGETTIVGSQEATIEPGYYLLGGINITYVPDEAGTYDLELGERNAGTIEVEEAVTDIQVIGSSVSSVELLEGEEFHVVGSIYQSGNVEGTEEIELTATNQETGETTVIGSQEATLEPGYYHLGGINVTAELDEPGDYDLELGTREVGTVTVDEIVTDIRVVGASLSAVELVEGEEVHVIGSLYQNGSHTATEEIELTATNQETGETTVVGSQEATLEPGYYLLGGINITYVPDEAGTYDLELGDQNAGTLEVEPAVSDIQVVAASTSEVELIEGEEAHIIGSVYQSGNVEGTEEIELTATNQETGETSVVGSQEVTLEPGYYHLGGINITYVPDEAGTYDLELGDQNAGTLEVEPAVSDVQVIAASPSEVELIEGEEMYVIGSIYQSGNVEGTEEIELTATNQETGETTVVGSQEVTLEPGYYHLGGINITYVPDEAGTYDLELGERNAGTVEVESAGSDIQVIAASTSEVELTEGEETHVIGSIYQAGNVEGTEEIELTATNQETGETTVVGSQEATLEPGYYLLGAINITYVPEEAGTYDLELGGQNAGWVDVSEPTVEPTITAVSGHSSHVDPETGVEHVHASDDATVDIDVEAGLEVEEVTLLVSSLETTYVVAADAGYLAGDTWRVDVPFDAIPDDGRYELLAIAVDERENAGMTDAPEILVVDRDGPSTSVTLEDVDSDDATVVVESDEPLAAVPAVSAQFTDPEDGSTAPASVSMESANENATVFTGTLEFEESGNYTVSVTGTDRAGNDGADTASVVVDTRFTLHHGVIEIDGSGSTIEFDVADDADEAIKSQELYLALSENTVNANHEGGETGVGFLTAELDSFIDHQLAEGTIESATITMAIDEDELPGGVDAEDVVLHHYDQPADEWTPVDSSVSRVGGDPFVVAQVDGFSTYGALVTDNEPPVITERSPADGSVLPAGTDEATVRFAYDDELSGIDVGSVSVAIDGVDVTADAGTSITSTAAEHTLEVADGASYEVTVVVADEAGNELTDELQFEVAESRSTDDGGSSGSGGGSGGAGGGGGGSGGVGSADDSETTDSESTDAPADDADSEPTDDVTGDDDWSTDDGTSGDADETSDDRSDASPDDGVPGFGVLITIGVILLVAVRFREHAGDRLP